MLDAASSSAHVLPDLIRPGLRIVFCGTAAGNVSAKRGAYYAHPQNRFWSALHAFGLTPRQLRPEEYPELPQWGLGLTDIAKQVSGMDRELPPAALGREACAALEAKITAAAPEWLAFTSLNAGRRYLGRAAGFGEQSERIGRTRLWLLPSPVANRRLELGPQHALVAKAGGRRGELSEACRCPGVSRRAPRAGL